MSSMFPMGVATMYRVCGMAKKIVNA
jgi:hypothetical protein